MSHVKGKKIKKKEKQIYIQDGENNEKPKD